MKEFFRINFVFICIIIICILVKIIFYSTKTFAEMTFKTVTKIESCADSGLCRVYFDDNSTDLLYYPYIGMKWIKDEK